MIGSRPKFMDSPYFVMDEDNWHLLPNAPAEVVKEFNNFMNESKLQYDESENEESEPVKKSFTDKIQDIIKDFSK